MTNQEISEKFREYGVNARKWINECKLLLPEIKKRKIWANEGFTSIYEYAKKLAGLSEWQVNDALRILRKIEDKPALQKVAIEKGLSAIRPVVAIASEKDEQYWAKRSKEMSRNELQTFVREIRSQDQPKTRTIEIDEYLAIELEKLSSGDMNSLIRELIELKKCKTEKPPTVKNNNHQTPAKIKKYILKRCNGKCEFPNCTKNYLHLHHTERWALNKEHNPDKIVALCKAHHDLAHKGLIHREELSPENWSIQKHPNITDIKHIIDKKVQFHQRN